MEIYKKVEMPIMDADYPLDTDNCALGSCISNSMKCDNCCFFERNFKDFCKFIRSEYYED
jgi:hypothetical protein